MVARESVGAVLSAPVPRYRGRLAPSPTGLLHLGHARTFWIAQERTRTAGGTLVLRMEDLDPERCRPEFARAILEDLRWLGLEWEEGPDCGGPHAPYTQSERRVPYVEAFHRLLAGGFIYPCTCSRRDVQRALQAPHAADEEPIYPGTCRPAAPGANTIAGRESAHAFPQVVRRRAEAGARLNWRFRVPDGEVISFLDGGQGRQAFTAGQDFGDFVVWRHDDVPAYQLAVTVDDAAMGITEVVRGCDLLVSTARQELLYRALGWRVPEFFHCPLLTDDQGQRLAKRHDALSLRALRDRSVTPDELRARFA